jgi:hypothetical protein
MDDMHPIANDLQPRRRDQSLLAWPWSFSATAMAAGRIVSGTLGGLVAATTALAAEPVENFPSRPIHIVLPFTPGGGTDIIARKLAPGMQQRLGQSVVIENKPGGNARIGAGESGEKIMRR